MARLILVAIVQCWVAAIVPASCTSFGDGSDVISISFPSFEPKYYHNEFQLSWDAGVLDGALHLTADDVYEPPVHYAPDANRMTGQVSLNP